MITGPPSQQSLPSIPPSPISSVSVHLSLVSSHSGPPSHTQFYAGTPPPTGPLPEIPSAAQLNPRIPSLSSSSPRTPPSLSLRGEQWPLRDDSRLDNMPKAQTVWPCPEPPRESPNTPGSSSPSSIRPESRKGLPKTALSLWSAPELSRKPLNTTVVSISPNETKPESRGGNGRMEPSPWLPSPSPPSPSPRQGPLGGEVRMEPSTRLISSPSRPSNRQEPIGGEPGMDPSPWSTGPSPRQRPNGGESLSSNPMSVEVETKPSASLRRPYHRRGPCGVDPPALSPSPPSPSPRPGGENRMEPSQRLTSQALREGSLVRERRMEPSPWLASPFPSPRPLGEEPSMEPSQRITSQSPRQGPLGGEPRMGPSPWLVSSPPRPRPLGGEPPMETSPRLTSQHSRQGPLGREPRIEPSPRPTNPSPPRPSPRQGPLGGELRTEPGPSNYRGPREGDLPTSRAPTHEPRTEPPTRLTGAISPCRGPCGGEPRASSSIHARPGMEPAPLLPRSTPRSESRVGESPTSNSTSLESNTVPFQPVKYPFPFYVPGSGPAPGPSHSSGLPPLPDIIEARDESVLLDFPITYHLALACAEDKHTSEMAESEQQLGYLKLKTKLYEDFFLTLEAGRSSSALGRGRREPRGRPGSLGELKFRLESQLRVMKAEETRISKGSGWF